MSDAVDMVDALVQAEAAIREHTCLEPHWGGLEDRRDSWWAVLGVELAYSTDRETVEAWVETEGEEEGDADKRALYGGPARATHDGSDGVFRGELYCCVPYDTQQGFECTPIFRTDREVKP